jgi:hypothetical protein
MPHWFVPSGAFFCTNVQLHYIEIPMSVNAIFAHIRPYSLVFAHIPLGFEASFSTITLAAVEGG